MNATLSKIRAKLNTGNDPQTAEQQLRRALDLKRAQAALPLLAAFEEIKDQPVKVELLKQIWTTDFDRRNDRLLGLVQQFLGTAPHYYGIKFHIPNGSRVFSIEVGAEETLLYTSTRDGHSGRPQYVTFRDADQWMEFFYKTMAYILEV